MSLLPLRVVLVVVIASAVGVPGASGQAAGVVRAPTRWVRPDSSPGPLDPFGGPWEGVAALSLMPPVPDSISRLRVAVLPTMIGAITGRAAMVGSCRQYSLVVQGPGARDRRAVFVLGDSRDVKSFRVERLGKGPAVRLFYVATNCDSPNDIPQEARFQVDVNAYMITVRILNY